jgi:hypothetical protein
MISRVSIYILAIALAYKLRISISCSTSGQYQNKLIVRKTRKRKMTKDGGLQSYDLMVCVVLIFMLLSIDGAAGQALNLLNSGFMMQQAGFFAERLEQEAGEDPAGQVRRAFALAFQRPPEAGELSASVRLIIEQGLTVYCRALLNANELVYVF